MDTVIKKKNKNLKKIVGAIFLLLLVAAFIYYAMNQKSSFNIPAEEVAIQTVSKGKFEDIVMITAKTESLNSSLVNVTEGGAVKEIYAEDGEMVAKNQPLARVYNPNTEFNYLNQETSIMQQISQMRSTLLEIQNQKFSVNKELLQVDNEYRKAVQQFNLQKRLFEAEIGKKKDFEEAQQNLEYQKKKKQITKTGVAQENMATQKQISSIQNSIAQMEKSLQQLRSNKNNFLILAPEKGRLSSFDLSIGENLNSGQSIGKIDLMDGYKLVSKVDEFYINKLDVGVEGVLKSEDKDYPVIISKILPEVKAGQFEIELNFVKDAPKDIRIGMTFGIRLKLSKDTERLIIPKGNFYKDTGGKWMYVIEGSTAKKQEVKLGRSNSFHYEVLSGLEEGDKVITSTYDKYKNYEILNLK